VPRVLVKLVMLSHLAGVAIAAVGAVKRGRPAVRAEARLAAVARS